MLAELLDELRRANEQKLKIAALTLSLVIPDICGKAETPGEKTKQRYIRWFDANVAGYFQTQKLQPKEGATPEEITLLEEVSEKYANYFPPLGQIYLTGEMVYWIRCKLLHEGAVQDPRFSYTIAFSYEDGAGAHGNSLIVDGQAYRFVNARIFVEHVIDACEQWVATTAQQEPVKSNLESVGQFRTMNDIVDGINFSLPVLYLS